MKRLGQCIVLSILAVFVKLVDSMAYNGVSSLRKLVSSPFVVSSGKPFGGLGLGSRAMINIHVESG